MQEGVTERQLTWRVGGGLFRARQTVLYGEKQEERNRARKMLLPGDEERSIADGSKLHSKSDVSEMD